MDLEEKYNECIKKNNAIIEQFQQSLENQKLSAKTIRTHVDNIEFYLNEYVAYFECENYLASGNTFHIGQFLGYYFIHKCMWSTPASIKTYITSLKKFYAFLLSKQLIEKEEYQDIVNYMKEHKDDWIEDCTNFNDPEYDYFGDYE